MKKYIQFIAAFFTICGILSVTRSALSNESTFSQVTGKKLLEYTWGPPRPEFVIENIKEMEKRPFDGTIMRPFFGSGLVFDVKHLREHKELILGQFKNYTPIKSDKLTDNFLAMYSKSSMDWFNDEDWKDVTEYVRILSAGAKKLGCVGVMFDPEPYGFWPWDYKKQAHANTKSFDEYAAKARQRGKEFMEAINAGFPDAKVLFLHSAYSSSYGINHNPNAQIRENELKNTKKYYYQLFLPFSLGMLEVSQGNNRLINTTQGAYGNTSADDFYQQYWVNNVGAKIFVPEDLRARFATYERTAGTAYIDSLMAGNEGVLSPHSAVARELTPQQRLQWLEYNTYQALKTSDEYAWLYGEQVTWWKESETATLNPFRDQMTEAILSAKRKLMNGEDIGFEVKPFVDIAKQKVEEKKYDKRAQIKFKSATIQKVSQPIAIDGKLAEKAYQEMPWLSEFVTFAETGGKPTVSTQAWAVYDDTNLYLSFRSAETNMSKQMRDDDALWLGESVDVSILKPKELPNDPHAKYFHLIVNPNNKRYNSIDQGTQSASEPFSVHWQSAVSSDANGWYVEIALPWREMGFQHITKGLKIHINLARQRNAGVAEFTSWSQYANKFQEPEHLGVFILE